MTFSDLNARGFQHNQTYYVSELEYVLSKIVLCYQLILANGTTLTNDENNIRNHLLLNYLKNDTIRQKVGLTNFLFDREVPEDTTIGRTDIKIQSPNTFVNTAAYYIIECKRIDAINQTGTTGLNAQYIKQGVCRFTSSSYSSYYHANGMIGFVVAKIDILENVKYINTLMTNSFDQDCRLISVLTPRTILDGFEHTYCSMHQVSENQNITMYHLMLDFSKNINTSE